MIKYSTIKTVEWFKLTLNFIKKLKKQSKDNQGMTRKLCSCPLIVKKIKKCTFLSMQLNTEISTISTSYDYKGVFQFHTLIHISQSRARNRNDINVFSRYAWHQSVFKLYLYRTGDIHGMATQTPPTLSLSSISSFTFEWQQHDYHGYLWYKQTFWFSRLLANVFNVVLDQEVRNQTAKQPWQSQEKRPF